MSSRIWRLAAVTGVAAIAVTGAIVASSSSAPDPETAPTVRRPAVDLAGIPERRGVLGARTAPLTLTEFVDPQCPVCAAAARDVLPGLVERYVRTGKVKLEARVLSFLGPDSETAARYADAARQQDRLWPFLETFYASQGEENSGYVTPAFLTAVARAAGVDPAAAVRHAKTAGAALTEADAEAQRLGVTGTPTFVLTRRDGTQAIVAADQLDVALSAAAR